MGMDLDKKLRKFHQAKWDEPIIFELSQPGERGVLMPKADPAIESEVGDGISTLPSNMIRKELPALPELGQMQVVKHYLRLSQENLGADLNVDIGQGTCTMKYSPKINDRFATSPKFTAMHPLQPEETAQGILEIIHKLDLFLREISGLDRFSFQPGGGSHAILGMASMVRAYHQAAGEGEKRDEIITTIFSHPSDYSAATVLGYKVINLYPNADGSPDLDALKAAVSDRTAALFITNPEDTGIFNSRIAEFTKAVHDVGGLCGYDQANANGILGITRAREAGFDLCFFNLHKTFSSPHGCGGPGSGALGATEALKDFLPAPLVDFDGSKYFLDYDLPNTIGKIRSFYGVMPAVVKAYSWIRALGASGLREVARVAVLNNNYLFKKVMEIRGTSAPYALGRHRIEQVRYS
ncbi:MAG: aminomethyl-transferring glycine dehydrogenase subunit GcvPB, partial [Longimicrobiales bacterium]|nr:aminomethyl-transferring glycine dehydrogenase subunit GcvPB [Longimicrobiales bacterium]